MQNYFKKMFLQISFSFHSCYFCIVIRHATYPCMTQKLNFGNLNKKGRRILKDLICNLSCIFIKIFKLRTFENKIFFFIIYLLCFWKILNEPKNDGTAESTGLSNHEKEGNIKIISVKL